MRRAKLQDNCVHYLQLKMRACSPSSSSLQDEATAADSVPNMQLLLLESILTG